VSESTHNFLYSGFLLTFFLNKLYFNRHSLSLLVEWCSSLSLPSLPTLSKSVISHSKNFTFLGKH
jgi:hypothetical protein